MILWSGQFPSLSTSWVDIGRVCSGTSPTRVTKWHTRALSASSLIFMIASSLVEGGMNVLQAMLTVFLGNLIVLVPMILNGHVGVQYGIPFPVYARPSPSTSAETIRPHSPIFTIG